MEKMKVNINQYVKVTLTQEGSRILGWQHKEGSEYRVPLWQLFQEFGQHLYNGCTVPFKNNTIEVEPWKN